jgi:hypothetical protein
MRFDFALLADFAQMIDGKLYVQGGGLTRVTAPTVPFAVPVAIAMRIEPEPDAQVAGVSELEVSVIGPDGDTIFAHGAPMKLDRPAVTAQEGEKAAIFVALTLSPLVLKGYGPHRVELRFDDARIELNFAVVRPAN